MTPYPAYRYIYPFDQEVVANLAYFFIYRHREPRDVEAYTKGLREALRTWRDGHEMSDLFFVDKGDKLLIWDLREAGRQPLTILTGALRSVYLACDSICNSGRLRQVLQATTEQAAIPDSLAQHVQPLLDRGLLLRSGDYYLSLAIPLGEYSPGPRVLARFQEQVRRMGHSLGGEVVIQPPPVLGKNPVVAGQSKSIGEKCLEPEVR